MKLTDMFPNRFLRGQDLHAPILARLVAIETDKVHPRPGVEESAFILRFEHLDPKELKVSPLFGCARTKAGYGLILRRTLVEQIMQATGTDDTDQWPGKIVVLEQATKVGRLTIVARARKNGHKPAADQTPAPQTAPAQQPPAPKSDETPA